MSSTQPIPIEGLPLNRESCVRAFRRRGHGGLLAEGRRGRLRRARPVLLRAIRGERPLGMPLSPKAVLLNLFKTRPSRAAASPRPPSAALCEQFLCAPLRQRLSATVTVEWPRLLGALQLSLRLESSELCLELLYALRERLDALVELRIPRNRLDRRQRHGTMRPERLRERKHEQQEQQRLSEQRLDAREETERLHMREARNHRDGNDVSFLQLPDALPHEHERHVVKQNARRREERAQRNSHAEPVEQREDHREDRKPDDDPE